MPKPKKKFSAIASQIKLKSKQNTFNAQSNTNSKTNNKNQAKNQDNNYSLKRKSNHQNLQNKRAKTNKQFSRKLQTNSNVENINTNGKSDKSQDKQNKGKNQGDEMKQKNQKRLFQDEQLNQKENKREDQNNNVDNNNSSDKNEAMVNQQKGNKKQKTQQFFKQDISSQKDQINQNKEMQSDKDQLDKDATIVPNSNWDKMKSKISGNSKPKFSRHHDKQNQQNGATKVLHEVDLELNPGDKSESQLPKVGPNLNLSIEELKQKKDDSGLTRIIALDCEMVGVGFEGGQSVVARVSIVNDFGNVLYDVHVRPKMRVTDFRTKWSGIRPSDLKSAVSFEEMQTQVAQILQGRILVGHSLQNDLKVLQIGHPKRFIRDTARYPPLLYNKNGRLRPKSLKQLAKEQLQLEIQEGEHSSVEDARTALYVYHKFRQTWEKQIQNNELQGYKYARFPKRKDAVKKTKEDSRKDQKSGNKISKSEEGEEELYQSSFSVEKMENMQLRMNDPFSDPMADL